MIVRGTNGQVTDPAEHKVIREEYQKIEEAKRQVCAEKLNAEEENDQQDKDEDKYVDEMDMSGTKVESKRKKPVYSGRHCQISAQSRSKLGIL